MADNHKLSALDRLIAEALGEGKVLGADDDPARKKWPALWDWLSRCYQGRDYIKTPATLTLRLGPGGVLASLVDRDLASSVEVNCAHLHQVFDALERALTSDTCPVKTWGRREPHLRKRRGS